MPASSRAPAGKERLASVADTEQEYERRTPARTSTEAVRHRDQDRDYDRDRDREVHARARAHMPLQRRASKPRGPRPSSVDIRTNLAGWARLPEVQSSPPLTSLDLFMLPSEELGEVAAQSRTSAASGATAATDGKEARCPTTEAGDVLRQVVLPGTLPTRFLAYAQANTKAERETCGYLLGHRRFDALCVTHLVIPEQTGTNYSCQAYGEEQLLAYQIQHDLLTIGWIHTHPTQTCFLSSLDLHTHSGYQALLPEAVAVVCAPREQPSVGVFRLTQPPGLQYILQCKDPEPFHAHADQDATSTPLYTDATHGHVVWKEQAPLTIEDWRSSHPACPSP